MQNTLRIFFLPAISRPAGLLSSVAAMLTTWRLRQRSRRHLGMLDARGLSDIGLSSAQQGAEAAKYFWQS